MYYICTYIYIYIYIININVQIRAERLQAIKKLIARKDFTFVYDSMNGVQAYVAYAYLYMLYIHLSLSLYTYIYTSICV